MPPFLRRLKALLWDTKIFENYAFMTAVNVVNGLVGFLVYPYVIRVLGAENYGLYAFVLAVSLYFSLLVNFGLYRPMAKLVVENKDDKPTLSKLISGVLTLRFLLALAIVPVFILLLTFVPFMRQNASLFLLGFLLIFSNVLNIMWYYRGLSRMRVVASILMVIRLLSIPFIIIFVTSTDDACVYMLITVASQILCGLFTLFWAIYHDGIKLCAVSFSMIKELFRTGIPFFFDECTMSLKENGLPVLIGIFFQMCDVALYDLAVKVVNLFLQFLNQVNSAIFPEYVVKSTKDIVRRILKIEWIMSLSIIAFLALTGYWIILLLGGEQMLAAYPLMMMISAFIVSGLVVGCYTNFVFIARGKDSYIAKNQLIATITMFATFMIGVFLWHNILIAGLAVLLSVISEVLYCRFVARRIMTD